jgi:hypothetical protein
MKNMISRNVVLLSLLVAVAAVSVMAQVRSRVTAQIPFAFSVANQTMPAGSYAIQSQAGANQMVLIRSNDSKAAVFALTQGKQAKNTPDNTKLVFRRYGSQYYLAQIWTKGEEAGTEFPVSKSERQTMKSLSDGKLAKADAQPEMITVVVD